MPTCERLHVSRAEAELSALFSPTVAVFLDSYDSTASSNVL